MRCAIYSRLSREDEERTGQSESIQNQRSMLYEYAGRMGWEVAGDFSDEDYSGADRERPGFLALLDGARRGEFDIVLCKTQSRFTRDMELVERYLHGKFPEWGVRFVTVVDNADTDQKGNKKSRQINGLVNEWYLEDLSENIRAVLDHKRKNGEYIASFALYGYEKDKKGGMAVEPSAAKTVKLIYSLCLAGYGKKRIAELLNEGGLPNPSRHKQLLGHRCPGAGDGLWSGSTVGRILTNEMYAGTLVQGKKRKASYKSKLLCSQPAERWFRTPDHHEAIISPDVFEAVQNLLASRARAQKGGEVHPLSGKVFCMDCGAPLSRTTTTYRGEPRSYLRCVGYLKNRGACTIHSVSLEALSKLAWERVQAFLSSAPPLPCRTAAAQKDGPLLQALGRRDRALKNLYLDYANGLVSRKEYEDLRRAFAAEKESITKALSPAAFPLFPVETCKRLTSALVCLFVDRILVGEKDPVTGIQEIEIRWLI